MDLIQKTTRDGWSDVETDFFVERYNMLINEVGKGKSFKTRKVFFQWMSEEMFRHQLYKTEQQITSRFYTLNRKNKKTNEVVNTSVGLSDGINDVSTNRSSSTIEYDSIVTVDPDKVDDSNDLKTDSNVEIVEINLNGTSSPSGLHSPETNPITFAKLSPDIDVDSNYRSTDGVMEISDVDSNGYPSASGSTETDFNDPVKSGVVKIVYVDSNGSSDGLDTTPMDSAEPNGIVSCHYLPVARSTQTQQRNLSITAGASKFSSTNIGIATIYNSGLSTVTTSSSAPILRTDIPNSGRATTVSSRFLSSHSTLVNPPTSSSQTINVSKIKKSKATFTVSETKYLLDQYYSYMDEIGPMKLFRTKNSMWETLASKMNIVFESTRTGEELSKRVTEVINRKKTAMNQNRVSGASRQDVQYEDELEKITALDDSIEPEVMRGVKSVTYKNEKREKDYAKEEKAQKKPRWDKPNKKVILGTLSDTMLAMEKRKTEREAAKEERRKESHKAMLEMLQSLKKSEN